MSVKSIRSDAEEFLEGLSWILLVPIVVSVIYVFGLSLGAAGVDEILHSGLLTGIELTIIPLSAIAAAWLRPGADRIRALRETRAGPYLPLLMAGTLVGLIAYLVWSWLLPQASFGPDGFGYARWAGTRAGGGVHDLLAAALPGPDGDPGRDDRRSRPLRRPRLPLLRVVPDHAGGRCSRRLLGCLFLYSSGPRDWTFAAGPQPQVGKPGHCRLHRQPHRQLTSFCRTRS